MGFRTVVILHNDRSSEWRDDPELGRKIAHSMNYAHSRGYNSEASFGYGSVVECAHADTQTIAVIDSYRMYAISHRNWYPEQSVEDRDVALLRQAAKKYGYRLHKIPTNRNTK